MLCSRSASLMTRTLMSRDIATTILRTVSAWAASPYLTLSSLVTPSTSSAISSPNSRRGADRLVVHAELGEDRGHRQRMGDVRVAAVPPLAGMLRRGDLVRVLYHPHVGLRMRRLNRLDQRLEYRVDAAARRSEPGQPAPDGGRPDRPVGGRRPGRGRRG